MQQFILFIVLLRTYSQKKYITVLMALILVSMYHLYNDTMMTDIRRSGWHDQANSNDTVNF